MQTANKQVVNPQAGVVQMNSGADVAMNLKCVTDLIAQASSEGAKLVVLPESFACIGKTSRQQLVLAEQEGDGPLQDFLSEQAVRHRIWLLGGTIPIKIVGERRVYAQSILYDADGSPVARYRKIHLFDVYLKKHDVCCAESATFFPGDRVIVVDTPLGRLGIAVCYDVRFPEMFRLMSDRGAQIVAVPAAFTHATGAAHWRTLLRARAIENQMYILASAQTGCHANQRETYGHSIIIGAWGQTLAEIEAGVGVICAEIDLMRQKELRQEFPCLKHRVF